MDAKHSASPKISSDSEDDVILSEAVDRACAQFVDEPFLASKECTEETNAERPKTGFRQRTLLEMLDKDYNQPSGPANKKLCTSSRNLLSSNASQTH